MTPREAVRVAPCSGSVEPCAIDLAPAGHMLKSSTLSRRLLLSRNAAFSSRSGMNNPSPYYLPRGGGYAQRPRGIRWFPIIIGLVFVVVAALILLILLYPASFGVSTPSTPYRFGLFGGFFFFFFILIVLFFIVRVAFWSSRASGYGRRRYGGDDSEGPRMNRPAMVARMRYARGEITREQYDQIMKDLGRPPSQQ